MRWMLVPVIFCTLLFGCTESKEVVETCEKIAHKELRVFSNNVGIFPEFMTKFFSKKVQEKKKNRIQDEAERAKAFVRVLLAMKPQPDVVLLQEIWSLTARDVLLKELKEVYPYAKYPEAVGEGKDGFLVAGLMTFSKYELTDYKFKEFSVGDGADKLSKKGVLGAVLVKDGRRIAVFNTHLQSGDKEEKYRPTQLGECHALIQEYVKKKPDTIAFLAGDFNLPSDNNTSASIIADKLPGAKDSYKDSCSSLKTTGRNPEDPTKRIDYLMVYGGIKTLSTIVDPAGDTISDHLAISGLVSLD